MKKSARVPGGKRKKTIPNRCHERGKGEEKTEAWDLRKPSKVFKKGGKKKKRKLESTQKGGRGGKNGLRQGMAKIGRNLEQEGGKKTSPSSEKR